MYKVQLNTRVKEIQQINPSGPDHNLTLSTIDELLSRNRHRV